MYQWNEISDSHNILKEAKSISENQSQRYNMSCVERFVGFQKQAHMQQQHQVDKRTGLQREGELVEGVPQ